MPGYFHLQTPIPNWGKKTVVNWNKGEVKKAVVFIHGFNGSAANTFGDFNLEFRHREEYRESDVYFYDYDSLFTQIPYSGYTFLDFLRAIHNDLSAVIQHSRMPVNRSIYQRMVIVAHSLGAVVARFALNKGHLKENWMHKCELILFAPAHKGAREEILDFRFPGKLGMFGPALRYMIPTIKQLTNKATIIQPLESECKALIDSSVTTFTIAKAVVWAQHDKVVINNDFLSDPEPERCHGMGHTEVCKPTKYFDKPFKIVADVL